MKIRLWNSLKQLNQTILLLKKESLVSNGWPRTAYPRVLLMRPYKAYTTIDGLRITTYQCFVFTPDGAIHMAYFNIPGCIHDGQVAEWCNIYAKLEKIFDKYEGHCEVDSGFWNIEKDFKVKTTQDDLSSTKTTYKEAKIDVRAKMAVILMQQLAEWGMRRFQASLPRIKDCFVYKEQGKNNYS